MFFFWSSGSNPSTDSAIKKNDDNPRDKIAKKERQWKLLPKIH